MARDVVRHLVEWMPGMFFGSVGLPLPEGPSVEDDPAGAWRALDAAFRSGLADAEVCARELEFGPAGRHTWEGAVATFCIGDVLMHTWDLARATGLDETLDPAEVHLQYEGMLPADELLAIEWALRPARRGARRRRRADQADRVHRPPPMRTSR